MIFKTRCFCRQKAGQPVLQNHLVPSMLSWFPVCFYGSYVIWQLNTAGTHCLWILWWYSPFSSTTLELNMYRMIGRTIHKQEFDPKNLVRCWEKCMDNFCYYSRRKATEEFNQQNYWNKWEIAIIPMKFSVGYPKTFYYQVIPRNTCRSEKMFLSVHY